MSEVTTEKLYADFKVLVDDTEQLISATAGQAGERIAELRQRLTGRIEQGKEALLQREKELRAQAERARSCAITFLREESWSRLALAAGLGMLLGLALFSGRSKRTRPERE